MIDRRAGPGALPARRRGARRPASSSRCSSPPAWSGRWCSPSSSLAAGVALRDRPRAPRRRWPPGRPTPRSSPCSPSGVLHLRLARVRAADLARRAGGGRGTGGDDPSVVLHRARRAPDPVAPRRRPAASTPSGSPTWPPSPSDATWYRHHSALAPVTDVRRARRCSRAQLPDDATRRCTTTTRTTSSRCWPRPTSSRCSSPSRRSAPTTAALPRSPATDGAAGGGRGSRGPASAISSTSPIDLWLDRVSLGPDGAAGARRLRRGRRELDGAGLTATAPLARRCRSTAAPRRRGLEPRRSTRAEAAHRLLRRRQGPGALLPPPHAPPSAVGSVAGRQAATTSSTPLGHGRCPRRTRQHAVLVERLDRRGERAASPPAGPVHRPPRR